MKNFDFINVDYKEIFEIASPGDLIYCDLLYSHRQSILYGAQAFNLEELLRAHIDYSKSKGICVALSIDGNKKSGIYLCNLPIPKDFLEEEFLFQLVAPCLEDFKWRVKRWNPNKFSTVCCLIILFKCTVAFN